MDKVDVVRTFDTTLRDGEQSPGASMTPGQKVMVGRDLTPAAWPLPDASLEMAG